MRVSSFKRVDYETLGSGDAAKNSHTEIPHITFKDNAALNLDGTWKHGARPITNAEKKELKKLGWTLPNE